VAHIIQSFSRCKPFSQQYGFLFVEFAYGISVPGFFTAGQKLLLPILAYELQGFYFVGFKIFGRDNQPVVLINPVFFSIIDIFIGKVRMIRGFGCIDVNAKGFFGCRFMIVIPFC